MALDLKFGMGRLSRWGNSLAALSLPDGMNKSRAAACNLTQPADDFRERATNEWRLSTNVVAGGPRIR